MRLCVFVCVCGLTWKFGQFRFSPLLPASSASCFGAAGGLQVECTIEHLRAALETKLQAPFGIFDMTGGGHWGSSGQLPPGQSSFCNIRL